MISDPCKKSNLSRQPVWINYLSRQPVWINPDIQTFGCSYEFIEADILHFTNSIPVSIISEKYVEKLKDRLDIQYGNVKII